MQDYLEELLESPEEMGFEDDVELVDDYSDL